MPVRLIVSALTGAALGAVATSIAFRKGLIGDQASPAPSPPQRPQQEAPASSPGASQMPRAPRLTPEATRAVELGYPDHGNVKVHSSFVSGYDRRTKTATWACEHINRGQLAIKSADRADSVFFEDPSEPPMFRAQLTDYRGSGFDRGHLVPAANHRSSKDSLDATFSLSNMSPQVGKGFNRDKWAHLESHCRKLTETHDNVFICSGPLYLSQPESDGKRYVRYQVIGKNEVAVPTHFYKVIAKEKVAGKGISSIESYILPNAPIDNKVPISQFRVSLKEIEKRSGLLFFDRVPNKLKVTDTL